MMKFSLFDDIKRNRKIFDNFGYLTVLKFLELAFPLLSVPYLTRVLGVDKFGLIAFAKAFNDYFLILVTFGFMFSATREISLNRNSHEKISEIFWATFFAKSLLVVSSLIILLFVVFSFDKFSVNFEVFVFSFGTVIANLLFPIWFFQGMEDMKFITLTKFISKIIFILSIFLIVKREEDFLMVPFLNSLSDLLAGIFSLFIVFIKFKVRFKFPSIESIKASFVGGYHIFISKVSTSLYTVSNVFFLGLFFNNEIVAYYSGGEKIVKAIQSLYAPIAQSVYPHISRLSAESKEKAVRFLKKLLFLNAFFTIMISLLTFFLAPFLVDLILGEEFFAAVVVVRILSFLPFIIGLSNIFGVQIMFNFGYRKEVMKIVLYSGIFHIFLLLLLIKFSYIGVSVSVLITETIITLSMFFFLNKKNINLFKKC